MANGYFNHTDPARDGTKVASAQYNNTMLSVQAGFDLLPTPVQFFYDNARYGVATVTATNVYALALPQISSAFGYVVGMGVLVKFPSANTGPAQININALGLKELRTPFGGSLQAGDLTPGTIYDMRYDGTYFQVLNAVDSAFSAINQYVIDAAASASAAAASASAASASAASTVVVLNNANAQYNQLALVVASLPAIPQATSTVLGTVKLTDTYTSTGDSVTALSSAGGFGLYTLLQGKAPTVHTHTWAQISGVPVASTSTSGIVQLFDGTGSASITLAATANTARQLQAIADGKAPTVHTHPWSQITGVPVASTSTSGITQLTDDVNSASATTAATANSVNQILIALNGKAPTVHTHTWAQISGVPTASTTQLGIVQLVDNLSSTSTVQALTANQGSVLQGLLDGKAPTVHTHTWSQITQVPISSLTLAGIVQLYDGTDSTSNSLAATANVANTLSVLLASKVSTVDIGSTNVRGVCILALTSGVASVGSTHSSANLLASNFSGASLGGLPTSTWTSMGFATGSATASPSRATLFVRTA